MRVHAFVFARAGSKRLPGKNLLDINGKPLVQHSIEFALSLGFVDRVFVSSDSEEILSIADELKAIRIERPPELATDECPEILAWKHAVEFAQKEFGRFDKFLSLPPTAPLRKVEDVKKIVSLVGEGSDYCVSICRSARNPWFSMVAKASDESLSPIVASDLPINRHQDAPDSFDLAAVGFATTPDYILRSQHLWEGTVKGVEVSRESSVDIDDALDFQLAKTLMARDPEK